MQFFMSVFIGLLGLVSVSAEPLIEGQVRLDSGEPVANAQVRLFDMSDLQRGAIARATTDGTGYFALPVAALTGRALPQRFALGQNYPNPFNPSTIIPYQLTAAAAVRLEVFNLLGQRIATLVDGARPAGFHTATWNATDGAGRAVGAGVYIYRMTVAAESQTGRMVLIDGQAGVSAGGTAAVLPGASGGGPTGASEEYGLIVSGRGLIPYADPAFRVEAGMAPVELVVQAGQYSAGKATDDDCALCDLFDAFDNQEALIVSAWVSDNTPTPGQPFTLRARVQNQGTDEFQNLVLSYYRSSDATISAQDMLLGTDEVGSLAASSTSGDESISLAAPSTSGTYYYGACVASVSDEGSTFNYCSTGVRVTVADDQDQVSIPDANLREAIAAALGKASGATITKSQMRALTILDANGVGIRDLTGLEFATNLRFLYLDFNTITDVSALRNLTNLRFLYLDSNTITDVLALRNLTNLERLGLDFNTITDVSPLSNLTNLTWLSLQGNPLNSSSINDILLPLKRSGTMVRFDPPLRESDFDIELVFLADFTASQKRAIEYAARRWMSIIRQDLPDYTFTEGFSRRCGEDSYRISAGERIDDLRIYITSFENDAPTVPTAWAVSYVLRETSYLPVVGCMAFNLEHFSWGNVGVVGVGFIDVALHEIAHVLGFGGTIWDALGFLQNPSWYNPNADTHFNGPLAIAAFNDAGGRNYAGAKVPVAEDGSHWRGSVLWDELMKSGGSSEKPLSAITIQSLADLGYSVDVTQADPYTLPDAAAKASAKVAASSTHAEPAWSCGTGQRQEPIYVVDPQGRIVRTLGDW